MKALQTGERFSIKEVISSNILNISVQNYNEILDNVFFSLLYKVNNRDIDYNKDLIVCNSDFTIDFDEISDLNVDKIYLLIHTNEDNLTKYNNSIIYINNFLSYSFDINLEQKAFEVFEIYKYKDIWKICFNPKGYTGGISSLLKNFNIFLEDINLSSIYVKQNINDDLFTEDKEDYLESDLGEDIMSIIGHECKICNFFYNPNDIYCSGCGSILSLIKIEPNISKIILYPNTDILKLKFENYGDEKDISFESRNNLVYYDKSNFILSKNQDINLSCKNLESGQKFSLDIKTNNSKVKSYNIEVQDNPDLEILINNEFLKDIIFIEDNIKYLPITIRSKNKSLFIIEKITLSKFELDKYSTYFNYVNSFDTKIILDDNVVSETKIVLNVKLLNSTQEYKYSLNLSFVRKEGIYFDKDKTPNYPFIGKKSLFKSISKPIELFYKIEDPSINIIGLDDKHELISLEKLNNEIKAKIKLNIDELDTGAYNLPFKIKYVQDSISYQGDYIHDLSIEVKEPKEIDLTIDFGTTNTCVAYGTSLLDMKIVYFPENEDLLEKYVHDSIPTLLYFENFDTEKYISDKFHYKNLFDAYFENTAWGWKKYFGSDLNLIFSDQKNKKIESFTIERLTALYLKKIIEKVKSDTDSIPVKFNFTYPANYESKKKVLIKAMKDLGYSDDKISVDLNESNALAYYFVTQSDKNNYSFLSPEIGKEEIFAIVDFGGGTTDITIAKTKNKSEEIDKKYVIEILDSSGPPELGGDYLDFELAKTLYEYLNPLIEGNIPFAENYKSFITRDSKNRSNLYKESFIKNTKFFLDISRKFKHDYKESNTDIIDNMISSFDLHDDQNKRIEGIKLKSLGIEDIGIKILDVLKKKSRDFISKSVNCLENLVTNLKSLDKIDKDFDLTKINIILCGNLSKLSLIEETFRNNKFENIKKPKSESDGKLGVIKGAFSYYHGNPDIELLGLNTLPVTIGYEFGGKFKTIFGRALSLSDTVPVYKLKTNLKNTKFSIFASLLTSNEIENQNIINNNQIYEISSINIDQKYLNKDIEIFIRITNQFIESNIINFGIKLSDEKNDPQPLDLKLKI